MTYLMVYGRMPVLEALADDRVRVEKVLLARSARGESVDEILAAAARRGIRVQRVAPEKVTRMSGNGRHDQGVVADIDAPGMGELDAWLPGAPARCSLLVLDGVTNPANVGMVVRTATGAGIEGVVLPRAGSPDVGPLVVKASAGVAFRATILGSPTASAAVASLRTAGIDVVGLRGGGESLFDAPLPDRAAFVLGNETVGLSTSVAAHIDRWLSIPLANDVDSLNVAVAAGIVAYEVARRRSM